MILQGLKPMIFDRLNKSGLKWLQELPAVVWSLRTTPSRAMGFTPFFLVYDVEAVLPTDWEYGSPRVKGYDEGTNQRAREDSLDQLDEARTVPLMHSARYQQALRQYQARKIWRRGFDEGYLVLRLRLDNRGRHKLSPHGRDPTSLSKCSSPAPTSWPTRTVRNSPTLGTSNSYAASILRKNFQVSFCYLHTQNPSWLYKCKSHQINKVKGRRLSPKNQVLLGGYYGGHPPQKNGPIFLQKSIANVLSMPQPKLWVNLCGT
jgi:hypothetical protein